VKLSEATAKSYARAIFELAQERNAADAVATELESVARVITAEPSLHTFLSRPWVSAAAKRGAATEVATKLNVSPLVRDFLALVAVRNRAEYLPAITEAYRKRMDEARGRVRVKLRTAVGFNDAERAELGRRLAAKVGGRELVIEETVDPKLLGGFVAEIGSTILDGSLDAQLVRMRDRLARA
jgi:F-type H+-transporting ATPase subunit delta